MLDWLPNDVNQKLHKSPLIKGNMSEINDIFELSKGIFPL